VPRASILTPRNPCRLWLGLVLAALPATPAAGQLPALIFVSRAIDPEPAANERTSAVGRASSGRLLLRRADGEIRALVDASASTPEGAPLDVADPDVSFDGERIVFAGYCVDDDAWRIFEIGADGEGFRQITSGPREIDVGRYGPAADAFLDHDDVDPCYLPDGRICFVSTRYPGGAPDGRVRANNLHVVAADGSGLRRITSERFGADTPTVEPSTGRVVYSRFWRTVQPTGDGVDPPIVPGSPGYEEIVTEPSRQSVRGIGDEGFPGVNSWFLAGINPDGTDLSMWSGFHLDRELTQAWKPSFLTSGEALALFLPVTPFLGAPRGYGLRRFRAGSTRPVALGGPQLFPRRNALPPAVDFRYASAVELPDGRLLVTAAHADSFDYDVRVQEHAEVAPELIHAIPGTLELDAVPLLARQTPPRITDRVTDAPGDDAPREVDEAFAEGGSFTFLCENVYFNAPVDVEIPNAPPVGKSLDIEFWLSSQRTSPDGDDAPVLIDRVGIPADGRIEATAPANVPLFEVLRRPDDTIAVGRDGQIFHVAGSNFARAGTTVRCVGCHAGHSMIAVPQDPTWTNLAPGAVVRADTRRQHGRLNLRDFDPVNLVDRRTGRPEVEWAAADDVAVATVELRWSIELQGREVVLHGTSDGDGSIGPRAQTIRGVTLVGYRRSAESFRIDVAEDILVGGTLVPLDPGAPFDRIDVVIPSESVVGDYEGRGGAALAEIEVISKARGAPFPSFVRGDSNCDLAVNVTDAVVTLDRLFRGGAPLCCDAAADADDNDAIEITDAVHVLGFLFRSGPTPAEPSGDCVPAPAGRLGCPDSACP